MAEHSGHSIRVTVQGGSPVVLHERALRLAKRYFDVAESELRVGLFQARPSVNLNGGVDYWEADIVVTWEKP